MTRRAAALRAGREGDEPGEERRHHEGDGDPQRAAVPRGRGGRTLRIAVALVVAALLAGLIARATRA